MSKDGLYYEEAENDVERKAWFSKPCDNVKDHLLPLIKSSFLCYSKGIQEELLECVEERIKSALIRKDPTLINYKKIVTKFVDVAKKNIEKNYLLI
jgi:hypothetical protein